MNGFTPALELMRDQICVFLAPAPPPFFITDLILKNDSALLQVKRIQGVTARKLT